MANKKFYRNIFLVYLFLLFSTQSVFFMPWAIALGILAKVEVFALLKQMEMNVNSADDCSLNNRELHLASHPRNENDYGKYLDLLSFAMVFTQMLGKVLSFPK